MLKRLIAAGVAVSIIASFANVFAADAGTVYLSEIYDNYVTNAVPSTGSYKGDRILVCDIGEKDKALRLAAQRKTMEAVLPVNCDESSITISFDITPNGSRPSGELIVQSGSVEIPVFKFDGVYGMKLYDGKNVGGFPMEKKTSVKLQISPKKMSAEINGSRIVSDHYIPKGLPTSYSNLKFSFRPGEDGSEILLDNIYAYTGNPVNLPAAEYNPEKMEITEDTDEAEEVAVGNTVMLDKDFEVEETQKTGFFLFSPKSNTLEFKTDKKTGNKYLEYTRTGTQDGLFDFSFGTQLGSSRYFVMDFDMKLTSNNPRTSLNMYATAGQMVALDIDMSGNVTSNGEQVYKFSYDDEWVHFAICMDYVKKVNKIYINGEYIGKEIDFDNLDADYLKSFRSYFYSVGSGSVAYDNIRFYEGAEPKDNIYEAAETGSGEHSASASVPAAIGYVERARELLSGYTAISYYANTYFSNGTKKKLENECYEKDGILYVPICELTDSLGCAVDYNGDVGRVIINDRVKWMQGDEAITVDGKAAEGAPVPEIKDGVLYFPIRFLVESVLNKKLTWDARQFVIIGDGAPADGVTYTDVTGYGDDKYKTSYWEIADMLNYDNANAETIKKAFEENTAEARPRILINSNDVQRMRSEYGENEQYKSFADKIIAQADVLVEENVPTSLGLANVEGNYLAVARQILLRLQQLGIAWFLTEDNKYAEQAWAELYNIGSASSWDRNHWLDLAEFQAAFAIGYDWFYNYWTEERRVFIKNATLTKAFDAMVKTYYTDGTGAGEMGCLNNRSIVMATGVGMTAIALFEDDPDYYADVLMRIQRNIHIVNRMWYPDGAWVEGNAYWSYTCSYLIYIIASLKAAFDTDFRLSRAIGFENAPSYLKTTNTSIGGNNFSDVGDMSARAPGEFSWFARWFGDKDTMSYRLWYMNRYNGAVDVMDIYYGLFDEDIEAMNDFSYDSYLRDSEIVTMRQNHTKDAVCVSFHGGEGSRPHGHWDIGTYVVDMMGERFAYDYGAESYGAASEGPNLYRKRVEGHNCLVFNPDLTVGQTGTMYDFSPVVDFVSKARGAYSVLDMTEAYSQYAASVKRGFMLANDRRSVVVRDEFTLKKKTPVYWFLQTKANVEVKDNKTLILTSNGKSVKLEMLSSSRDAKFTLGPAEPLPTSPKSNSTQTVNTGFTRVMIQFEGNGDEYIEVRYIPVDDPAADSDMLDTPLDKWSIEDGEIQEFPLLDALYVDGKAVEGFDPNVKFYTVDISDTYEKLPQISAEAKDAQIYITNPENASGTTDIKVANGEYSYSVYKVLYKLIPTIPDLNTLEEIKIKKVKASAEPQSENPAKGAIDRDINTRWSAQDVCWIEVELDGIYDLSRVGMIAHDGSKRILTFNIEVSEDGKTYTKVYDNMTSGTTEEQEYYNISGARGKYVRINCFGTTVGNWNSIKEIYVYKNK